MNLKPKDIKPTREALHKQQGYFCALCHEKLLPEQAVLDHDHKTGLVRATLHRQCNSALGAIERSYRYGIKDILTFAKGAAEYLEHHSSPQTDLMHPAHNRRRTKKRPKKKS